MSACILSCQTFTTCLVHDMILNTLCQKKYSYFVISNINQVVYPKISHQNIHFDRIFGQFGHTDSGGCICLQ